MSRAYVLAEDRPEAEVGLRFAIASLFRSAPDARAVVYWPCETPDFRNWAVRYAGLTVIPNRPTGASSWNCKPHALLPLLEGQFEEVVWLDSDMLVSRDPEYLFDSLGPDTLVGTEEPPNQPHPGSSVRTTGWGLKEGNVYAQSLNTSALRVTRHHIPLLKRWRDLLGDPTYRAAQMVPLHERPPHLLSDQDVLLALLGSDEFKHCPLRYLRCGREVIHCGGALGYSLAMRLSGLFRRVPVLLHAISGKPWWIFTPDYRRAHGAWFTFYRRLLQETSPYVREARRFRDEVGIDCPWLDYRSALGVALRAFGCGHFALSGLPLTLSATVAVQLQRFRGNL